MGICAPQAKLAVLMDGISFFLKVYVEDAASSDKADEISERVKLANRAMKGPMAM